MELSWPEPAAVDWSGRIAGRVASRMSTSDVNRVLSSCGSEILLFLKKAHKPDGIMNGIVPSQALQLMEKKQRPLAVVAVVVKNLRVYIARLHEHLQVA